LLGISFLPDAQSSAESMVAEHTPTSQPHAQFARMKLLIIDDEPENVAILHDLLVDSGYTRVKTLTNSSLALETCRSFDPDLILLDLFMPQPDGLAVLTSLRADRNDVFLPVVVLTGDTSEEMKRRVLAAGATDFLVKPFDFFEVLLRIGNLLETRRLHMKLEMQRAAYEDAVRERTAELRELEAQLDLAER
jgi:DNA-binding response OmpR family regulator